jgi:hypothetical protein
MRGHPVRQAVCDNRRWRRRRRQRCSISRLAQPAGRLGLRFLLHSRPRCCCCCCWWGCGALPLGRWRLRAVYGAHVRVCLNLLHVLLNNARRQNSRNEKGKQAHTSAVAVRYAAQSEQKTACASPLRNVSYRVTSATVGRGADGDVAMA